MILSMKKHFENINISLNGKPIALTSQHMLKRMFIDGELKFDEHINNLCTKVSQSNGVTWSI